MERILCTGPGHSPARLTTPRLYWRRACGVVSLVGAKGSSVMQHPTCLLEAGLHHR